MRATAPHSNPHRELVALVPAWVMPAPHILTDSLVSLHLLRSWGTLASQRVLQTANRALVRQVVHLAEQLESPPLIEKVKAHDERAIAVGHRKAVGNESADSWAKRASTEAGHS